MRDIINKEIKIYTDSGRIQRPLFLVENNQLKINKSHIAKLSSDHSSKRGASKTEGRSKARVGSVAKKQILELSIAVSMRCKCPLVYCENHLVTYR